MMSDYISQAHEAQGVVEYAIILLLMALAIFGSLQLLGPVVANLYTVAEQSFP